MNEQLRSEAEMERNNEVKAKVLGRLGDLKLGNPNGIPSTYATYDAEALQEIADEHAKNVCEPTDLLCAACVDGRRTLQNADGSDPEVRLRRVGGSASNFGVALNADASIVEAIDRNDSLSEQIQTVDDFMGARSAHEGGCGGANGEIADHELIAHDPAILEATKTFMAIPEVEAYFAASYDEALGARVRENALATAEFLRANKWDGQTYVNGVVAQNPGGVETLEVDHDDHAFHGHKEPSLTIIIGDKTMPLDHDGFVWNLKATKLAAERLAGERGHEGYVQALIADVAKHMAVCKRLPSEETPIFLIVA